MTRHLMTLTALAATACLLAPTVASAESAPRLATSVSAGDLADDPERWYHETVTVRAEVEDVRGDDYFMLDEDKLFGGPDVMVIMPDPLTRVPEGMMVRVTGEVIAYAQADLERHNHFFSRDHLELEVRRRPIIIAHSVQDDLGVEFLENPDYSAVLKVSAGDIAETPLVFQDRTVSVRAEVEDTLNTYAFLLDEDEFGAAPDPLVLVPLYETKLNEGAEVTVIGKLSMTTPLDVKRYYGWVEVDAELREALIERPTIIADSIIDEDGRQVVLRQAAR